MQWNGSLSSSSGACHSDIHVLPSEEAHHLSRLIVIACLVEMGELLARWILAAAASSKLKAQIIANRQQVLAFLEEVGV
ncbi:hypothetical protein FRC18_003006 [Serendipita sp. 400]|nr:hypothetical protein FRC18_003006 [Serendipita sp. 400]